jgi:predicted  nucleic acid-binding Zn-ribbon protein
MMKKAFKHLLTETDAALLTSPAVLNRSLELGMSPEEDSDLMWIAIKSLQAALPKGWIECRTEDDYKYYWNEETDESLWTSPVLPYYSELFKKLKTEMKQAVAADVLEEERQQQHASTPQAAHPPPRDAAHAHTPGKENVEDNHHHQHHHPGVPGLISPTPPRPAGRDAEIGGLVSPVHLNMAYNNDDYLEEDGRDYAAVESPTRQEQGQGHEEGKGGILSPFSKGEKEKEMSIKKKVEGFGNKRVDMLENERDALQKQCRSLEDNLQMAVLDIAKMHDEKFRGTDGLQEQLRRIHAALHSSTEFLERRGFHAAALPHNDDHDPAHVVDDIVNCLDSFEAALCADHGVDDSGYAKTFNAAVLRLREELQKSFEDKGPVLRSDSIDTASLVEKLSALSNLIMSFGEYLAPGAREAAYAKALLAHIVSFSDKDTLVPLKLMASLGVAAAGGAGADGTADTMGAPNRDILATPASRKSGAKGSAAKPSIVNIPAPSRIASVVKELEDLRHENITLATAGEDYKQQIEVLTARLKGAENRLNDASHSEEATTNKFDALMRSMDEIKTAAKYGISADSSDESNARLIAAKKETEELQEKATALETELVLSNRRASEAERRLERAVDEFEEREATFKSKEVAMGMQLDDRKANNQALVEGRAEIEAVSHELYAELQESLAAIRKLSGEKEHLKAELTKARGKGEYSSEQLAGALEHEKKRVTAYEATLEDLRRDVDTRSAELSSAEHRVEDAKMKADEMREHLERQVAELNRARKRNESLADENTVLLQRMDGKSKDMALLVDKLAEVQGSIRVFCRVRPVFPSEIDEYKLRNFELAGQVRFPDTNVVEYAGSQVYEFDRVFEATASQADVYDEVQPTVKSVLDGHKVCMLSYGITDSGKSFSLFGHLSDPHQEGAFLRGLTDIYTEAARDELVGIETSVRLSVVDIYNERVCDMLSKDAAEGGADLEIRMGQDGITFAEGLISREVRDPDEVKTVLGMADNNRQAAAGDDMNRMCRGHLVVMVQVHRFDPRTHRRSTGWLYGVDLAGSERVHGLFSQPQRIRESQLINRTLVALNDVITGLAASGHSHKHIAYRNSKLTFLLQKVLRPGSRVLLLANIDPLPSNAKDTVDTLNFATKCREVQLGPTTKDILYDAP